MMDEPIMASNQSSSMDDDCKKACDAICEGKSISQIRDVGRYFMNKADELNRVAENDMTIEDFENVKKQDLDNDQGEGESHGY